MSITLDPRAVRERLRPFFEDPAFERALRDVVADRELLAACLVGISEGEALGEVGVATIRQEEVAGLIHDLLRQELEEQGHKEAALEIVEQLFPDLFADGQFVTTHPVPAREYYFRVREANRQRLKQLGRYSRLNLYLTTTFGYEVMAQLLYAALARAVARAHLPDRVTQPIAGVLGVILEEEESHLDTLDQHRMLAEADRSALSPDACAALDALADLTEEDYVWAADLAVREVVATMQRFADLTTAGTG